MTPAVLILVLSLPAASGVTSVSIDMPSINVCQSEAERLKNETPANGLLLDYCVNRR
jgi:hypothetical protein